MGTIFLVIVIVIIIMSGCSGCSDDDSVSLSSPTVPVMSVSGLLQTPLHFHHLMRSLIVVSLLLSRVEVEAEVQADVGGEVDVLFLVKVV